MAGERTIKVKFTGDASDLNRAAHESERAVSGWSGGMKKFGAVAAAAGVAAGVALFQFAKQSVAAFTEAEQAQLKLTDAFNRFPNIADTNIGRLQALNAELARKTKFDDDATAAAQATLAQYGLTGKQLEDLTPLVQDFAAKTGQDVTSAAASLGKALLGQGRALKAVGIDFTDLGSVGANFEQIMTGLNDKVGGFAEEQGKTAAGQAAILSNQFGELKETVGAKLLPVLLKLADTGLKVVDWISKNQAVVGPLIAVIAAVVAIQWAWNIAMAANPIGLIVIGIAALVAAIVWIATKTTFFQDVWNASWGWIKRTAMDVWNWFTSLPAKFEALFKSIANFITAPFRWAFNKVSEMWNNSIGKLSWTVPGWVPVIGGNTISAPRLPVLPALHSGGIVPGPFGREVPIMALAGERVLPIGRSGGAGGPDVLRLDLDLGHDIHRVVEIDLREHDRGIRRRVLAGAGQR